MIAASIFFSAATSAASGDASENGAQRVLRFVGSNTIGESLAPALMTRFLASKNAQAGPWLLDEERRTFSSGIEHSGDDIPDRIEFSVVGSDRAFAALLAGEADVGMSSRRIERRETAKLVSLGDMESVAAEQIIGLDGLVIVVNPNNPVTTLSSDQVAKIFRCEITSWSQVGGRDAPIKLYGRESSSASYRAFQALSVDNRPLCDQLKGVTSSSALADAVNLDPDAIAFVGIGYVGVSKSIGIKHCGITYSPSPFFVRTEEYPLSRRLYLYTPPGRRSGFVDEFLSFVQSSDGQRSVDDLGFVGLSISSMNSGDDREVYRARLSAARRVSQNEELINLYSDTIRGAERLSVTFRFDYGDAWLDNRAKADIGRLVDYMQRPENRGRRLMLLGFADTQGYYENNLVLSQLRAQVVQEALAVAGVAVSQTIGFGEEAPVACNDDEGARELNRRVEVWVK